MSTIKEIFAKKSIDMCEITYHGKKFMAPRSTVVEMPVDEPDKWKAYKPEQTKTGFTEWLENLDELKGSAPDLTYCKRLDGDFIVKSKQIGDKAIAVYFMVTLEMARHEAEDRAAGRLIYWEMKGCHRTLTADQSNDAGRVKSTN
jgi:hypothetical protein